MTNQRKAKASPEALSAREEQRREAKSKLRPVTEKETRAAEAAAKKEAKKQADADQLPVVVLFVNRDGSLNRVEWPGVPATAVPTLLRLAGRVVDKQLGLE